MGGRLRSTGLPVALGALAMAGAALAQAPIPGVPASQPAPKPARLADGKPNWTGFWTPVGGLMDRDYGFGAPATAAASAPAPAARTPTVGAQVAASPASPLKSPYKEKYETLLKEAAEGKIAFDPAALCLPPGMPRMMGAIYGMEVLQTPGQITITGEWQNAQRRIWLDGRKHPDPEEALPTYAGHSVGRWEGDVLVVETVQVRDDTLIDQSGLMHTEKMRIVERFRSAAPGVLINEITVEDPDVYTAPWTMTRRYRYRPELNLQEYVCQENNRNVGPNGEPVFK